MNWYNIKTNRGVKLDPLAIWNILLDEKLDNTQLIELKTNIRVYYFADFTGYRLYIEPDEREKVIETINDFILMSDIAKESV